MVTTTKPLLALTAEEVMSREVVTIPRRTSLRDAARLFRKARISGAPVVDEQGRCVGILSAADFLHWVEDGCSTEKEGPILSCPYQTKGRLLSGEEAVICTLAEGSCPLQDVQPTTGGRHTAVCLQPRGILADWQQVFEDLPGDAVSRYMTTDVVSAGLRRPLSELALMMVDAHLHRIPVLDERRIPVGVVTSTDVLAGVAWDWLRSDPHGLTGG